MTNLTITIDSAQVNASLTQLTAKLNNMQPVMNAIAHDIAENVRLTFRELKTPYGAPWKTLSPVTVSRRRGRSGVPLSDTGVLRNSIAYNSSSFAAEIGTNAPQSAMMNFGGTKTQFPHLWGDIPARQFMPSEHLPADWEAQLISTVNNYLRI